RGLRGRRHRPGRRAHRHPDVALGEGARRPCDAHGGALPGGRCRVGDPAFQQRPRDHALPARRVRGGVHRGRPGRRVPRRRALRTRPVRRGPHLRPPTSCNDTRKWTTMTTTTRSGDPGETADALVARMTREEKLSFVAWGFDPAGMKGVGYLPGVLRLGIAPLRVADGPVGIRLIGEPATALPAPVAL